MQLRIVSLLVNNKLERISEEAIMVYNRYCGAYVEVLSKITTTSVWLENVQMRLEPRNLLM
jgi:hypothetical protein